MICIPSARRFDRTLFPRRARATRWSPRPPGSAYDVHAAGLAGLCTIAGLWFLQRPAVTSRAASRRCALVLLTGTSLITRRDAPPSHALVRVVRGAPRTTRRPAARLPSPMRPSSASSAGFVLVRHTNAVIRVLLRARSTAARAARVTAAPRRAPQSLLYRPPPDTDRERAWRSWFHVRAPHFVGASSACRNFFYAPVLLVAVAGLFLLPAALRSWRWPSFVALALATWLIASWWDWQFGASFGHRGFVDVYPILAVGLASAFSRIALRPRARIAAAVSIAALCALSMFQMLQYWHGVLPAADLTWQGYRDVFLKVW